MRMRRLTPPEILKDTAQTGIRRLTGEPHRMHPNVLIIPPLHLHGAEMATSVGYGTPAGDHRSYSLTSEVDHSTYSPHPSPAAIQRERSRRGPSSRSSYQRASSWSQAPGEYTRGYEGQQRSGRRLSVDLCTGPTYGIEAPNSRTHHRHSIHGSTIPPSLNDRSRTYSMTSMRSDESGNRHMTYPDQFYQQPQYYHSNPSYRQGRSHGGGGGSQISNRSPQVSHQDPYASNRHQLNHRAPNIVRPSSAPFPLQQTNQTPPSPTGPGGVRPKTQDQLFEQERQQRVSRRSSYSKLLGIPSDVNQTDGAGFEVAHESFRSSAYSWDHSGLRMSSLNLCIEGGGETNSMLQSGDNDAQWAQEERKKLNDNDYTTTLDATTRPYTPDKFITANAAATRESEGRRADRNNGGVSAMGSRIWSLGRTKSSSPKLEGNEVDAAAAGRTPSLSDEEVTSSAKRDGKRLLKRFRPKKSRSSLDLNLSNSIEVGYLLRGKNNSSGVLDGMAGATESYGRALGGGGGGGIDDIPEAKTGIKVEDVSGPYTATTKSGPTTGVISKSSNSPPRGRLNPNNFPQNEVESFQTRAPKLLGMRPSDNKFVAYLREKLTGLRRVITVSGGSGGVGASGAAAAAKDSTLVKIKSTPNSTLKYKLVAVKGKTAAVTAATTEVMISGHKRIPSRSNTPVPPHLRATLSHTEVGNSGPGDVGEISRGRGLDGEGVSGKGTGVQHHEEDGITTTQFTATTENTSGSTGGMPLISLKKMWLNTKEGWGIWDDMKTKKVENNTMGKKGGMMQKEKEKVDPSSLNVQAPSEVSILPPRSSPQPEIIAVSPELRGAVDHHLILADPGFEVVGGRGAGRAWGVEAVVPDGEKGVEGPGKVKVLGGAPGAEIVAVGEGQKSERADGGDGIRENNEPEGSGSPLVPSQTEAVDGETGQKLQGDVDGNASPVGERSPRQKQTAREAVWSWISGGGGAGSGGVGCISGGGGGGGTKLRKLPTSSGAQAHRAAASGVTKDIGEA
ncbi:hypothetical protein DFH27DRAFT_601608 [Peziza echinospora]|nr:hypothetical protein DFH27DRAFT_601608 [Peziza echinospora]